MFRAVSAILAGILGWLSVGVLSAAVPQGAAKVVVIPVRQEISKPELYIIRRGLKEAIENHVDTIVLDMETPGGRIDVTFDILKALEKFPGKTVTYVNREAISAGAYISAATDEIWFAPGAVIGAAAPVGAGGADIGETMKKKFVSYLKARMRAISEGKGYRGEVISAMIDSDSEFKIGDTILKPGGELLSLTAKEAMAQYGDPPEPLLGTGIAANLTDLLDKLHGPGAYTIERLQLSWSETLAQYLNMITPVLLGLGLLALFIEFKTPGFGVFGISGIVLLGVVFFGQFVAGLSGHEPVLFFLLGVLLVALELFFFPGIWVVAFTGIVLIFGSLVWAMADLWPNQGVPMSGDIFLEPLLNVGIGIVLAVVVFAAILRFLPRGGLWGNMVLHATVGGEPGARTLASSPAREGAGAFPLLGETGVAVTALFPSGQVEIAGRRYEARLAVGFAEKGAEVRVTGKAEFGLAVEVVK